MKEQSRLSKKEQIKQWDDYFAYYRFKEHPIGHTSLIIRAKYIPAKAVSRYADLENKRFSSGNFSSQSIQEVIATFANEFPGVQLFELIHCYVTGQDNKGRVIYEIKNIHPY